MGLAGNNLDYFLLPKPLAFLAREFSSHATLAPILCLFSSSFHPFLSSLLFFASKREKLNRSKSLLCEWEMWLICLTHPLQTLFYFV
jgi:hypothetical protein